MDDGSTDGSEKICDLYAAKYNNFVCIYKKNSGQAEARNVGLDLAKGVWIGFVDADDFVDLNYYEEMYNCAISNNSDMVCVTEKFLMNPVIWFIERILLQIVLIM